MATTLQIDFITSLDGFGAAEGWPGWWGMESPEYLGWLGEQPDHLHLMGATTYRLMSGMAAEGEEGTEILDDLRKVVFSSTLTEPLAWPNTRLVSSDPIEAVREMKRSESLPLTTLGSLTLCRTLLAAGLVDRYRVVVFPVVTGATGQDRVYDGWPDVALDLTHSRTFEGGLQLLEYAPRVLDGPLEAEEHAMSIARVHNFSISLDGFGSGEPQTLETPFGHAGERLHEWMFATRFWDQDTGAAGADDSFAQRNEVGIGAEIMGANKFGPPGWQDDPDWKGWWGPNPPFHSPTFVLTHRPRPPIEMAGGTTFHFLDTTPAEALAAAQEAAGGLDVRIGGGATVVRDFVAAGLVDYLHLVQTPIVLGRGTRVWDGLEALEDQYDIEAVSTPSGVTHLTFTRKR